MKRSGHEKQLGKECFLCKQTLTTTDWSVVFKQCFIISDVELLKKRKLYSWVFFLYSISVWSREPTFSSTWNEYLPLMVLCCRSVSSSLCGTIMCVNQRRSTQNIDFQVVIRKLVTLDALQPEYNVSEIIVKAPLALILMLYVSKSRHALGKANCMNVHFF